MLLDGSRVEVGDSVYHVSAGVGRVETISEDGKTARVRMGDGGILEMRLNGYSGFKKVFYWYKPLMLTPEKGKQEVHKKAFDIVKHVIAMVESEK